MKTKMSLSAEMDLTQDSVVQLTCWCGQIALHELWGLGRTRLDRITRRKELPDQPAKVKRKPIGGVIDPSALAYDVHDLMIYNEKARKNGKPELTYGYWAEKGKPATP